MKFHYTFNTRTVFPSVTPPCHLSLFRSVPPEIHGTTTNVYASQVRPIDGLFEQIKSAGEVSAMFYGWEPLRNVSRPVSIEKVDYINAYLFEHRDGLLTDSAIDNVKKVIEATNGEYTVIVNVDHGGHERAHGTDMDEDMTVPMMFFGPDFEEEKELSGESIFDIAPTIAEIVGI